VLLLGNDKLAQPVFVHRHLLNGRALRRGTIYRTALDEETNRGCWEAMEILTIRVDLGSLRSIEMWSRWLYGQKMWSEDDCQNPDIDLGYLMDIFKLCFGCNDGKGRDYEGLNACMDAIRDLLLNETHVPGFPIHVLMDKDQHSDTTIKMLADLLVYGNCVSDGRTKEWLEENDGEHPALLNAVSGEFAKKAMGEAPPDIMAHCAYHTHAPGSDCHISPHGRAWKGESTARWPHKDVILTNQLLRQTLRTQYHAVRGQSRQSGP